MSVGYEERDERFRLVREKYDEWVNERTQRFEQLQKQFEAEFSEKDRRFREFLYQQHREGMPIMALRDAVRAKTNTSKWYEVWGYADPKEIRRQPVEQASVKPSTTYRWLTDTTLEIKDMEEGIVTVTGVRRVVVNAALGTFEDVFDDVEPRLFALCARFVTLALDERQS